MIELICITKELIELTADLINNSFIQTPEEAVNACNAYQ